ncbi:MAG: hypothetical protein U0Q11_02625 [Vicinamibacterales bacterium]
MKRLRRVGLTLLSVVMFVAMLQRWGQADGGSQPVVDPLPYSLSYTLPGNYAVSSVDFQPKSNTSGFQTETLRMSGVPAGANIVAAWLYWETAWQRAPQSVGAKFRGKNITLVRGVDMPRTQANASCWNNWSTITEMRADVLPLLALELDTAGNPTGRRLVNDADLTAAGEALNTVTLPEQGKEDDVPESAGATLIVVYQDPSPTAALRRIVVFDGGHILARGETTVERVRGYYQTLHTPESRSQLTHILSSSDYGKLSGPRPFVSFNGLPIPFSTIDFGHTDNDHRAWMAQTLDVSLLTALVPPTGEAGEQFAASITRPYGDEKSCLTEVATVFSTTVKDSDNDGLLDIVEDPSPFRVTKLRDPNGQALPQLQLMGAKVGQKDVFVEVTAMRSDSALTYGSTNAPFNPDKGEISVVTPAHNHLPSPRVLKQVGDALGRAGISAHFDVGPPSAYRARFNSAQDADAYLVGSGVGDGNLADESLARGGESIVERPCNPASEPWCQFPDFPGTVDWKLQYQQLRDAWVSDAGAELTTTGLQDCATRSGSATPCRRRFDPNRNNIFRTVLFSHARGMSRSPFPCVPSGVSNPTTAQLIAASNLNATGNCGTGTTRNPQFHVPQRSSGVSDLPGQSAMVSLGLSKDGLGTEFFQASTLLHEVGHLLNLWHGGGQPTFTPVQVNNKRRMSVFIPPNCGVVQSTMSYLYQLNGLVDAAGVPHIDYSSTVLGVSANGTTSETNLSDGFLYGNPKLPHSFLRAAHAWFIRCGARCPCGQQALRRLAAAREDRQQRRADSR